MKRLLICLLLTLNGCDKLITDSDVDDLTDSKGNCLLGCTGGAQCHDDVSHMDCLSLQCLTDADSTNGYEWYVDNREDMNATSSYIKWTSSDPSSAYYDSLQTCDAICASIVGGATFILPRYTRPECFVIKLD